MNNIGVARKIDPLGRVVIPKELRTTFDLKDGDILDIFVDNKNIIMRKHVPGCAICGNVEHNNELLHVNQACICKKCANIIKNQRR